MAGIFDTSNVTGTMGSAVTPKEGVAPVPSMGPQLAGLAIEAGKEVATQYQEGKVVRGLEEASKTRGEMLQEQRAKAYEDKFEAFALGQAQGMPTARANMMARATLNEAVNALPWAAERLKGVYQGYFGGGSEGFEKDPLEVAAEEHYKAVVNRAAALGVGLKEGEISLRLDAHNSQQKAVLESIKLGQENASPYFQNHFSGLLNTSSMQINQMVRGQLQEGQTTLQAPQIQGLKGAIGEMAMQKRRELRALSRDPSGGMKIDEQTYERLAKEIDDWETKEVALLGNRDYLTVLKAVEETGNSEIALKAQQLLPGLMILNKGAGQVGIQTAIDMVQSPAKTENLIHKYPQFAHLMLNDTGKMRELTATSLEAMLGVPEPDSLIGNYQYSMSQGGAVVLASELADSSNTVLVEQILKQNGSEEEGVAKTAQQAARDLGQNAWEPTSKMLATVLPKFEGKYPEQSWSILLNSLDGVSQNIRGSIFRAGGGFPEEIRVTGSLHSEGRTFTLETSDGTELPDEAKQVIAHMFGALRNNPMMVERFEESLGIPLTPSDVLEIFINDKIPQRLEELVIGQQEFQPYRIREGLTKGGARTRPPTAEEQEAHREAFRKDMEAMNAFAKEYTPAPRHLVDLFNYNAALLGKVKDFRTRVQRRVADSINPPTNSIPVREDLRSVAPEPQVPTITRESFERIMRATTLEEKKAIAREEEIPDWLVDMTPKELADIIGIPR